MRRWFTIAAAAALAACSQGTSPTSAVGPGGQGDSIPLTVINTSNAPVLLRGAPEFRPAVPQLLGGDARLGIASPGRSCLMLPRLITISGQNVATGQVRTIVWSAASAITLTALDSTGMDEVGAVQRFVPDSADGWMVTFPGFGGSAVPAPPCRR